MAKRLAILILTCAACSDGGDGAAPDGGFVRVEHRTAQSGAEATYARAEFGDLPLALPKRGRCERPSLEPSDASWLDVGETVTLARADAPAIVLPRATLGSLVVYGADGLPASASPADARFDVTLAGTSDIAARTWEDAIEIPSPVVPEALVNQIGFLIEQRIGWTPSGDADEVLIEIASAGHVDLACRARDSAGEVVLSAEQNAELAAAGGTLSFHAIRRRHEGLGGRRVTLEGRSSVVVPYE